MTYFAWESRLALSGPLWRRRPIGEILRESIRIFLIGAPGSGKSTLVSFLASRCAMGAPGLGWPDRALPFVIVVRELKDDRDQLGGAGVAIGRGSRRCHDSSGGGAGGATNRRAGRSSTRIALPIDGRTRPVHRKLSNNARARNEPAVRRSRGDRGVPTRLPWLPRGGPHRKGSRKLH